MHWEKGVEVPLPRFSQWGSNPGLVRGEERAQQRGVRARPFSHSGANRGLVRGSGVERGLRGEVLVVGWGPGLVTSLEIGRVAFGRAHTLREVHEGEAEQTVHIVFI